MYHQTKISKGNQISIPSQIREKYQTQPGDIISWYDTEDGIYLKIEKNIEDKEIIGILKEKPKQKGLDQWR